MTLVLSEVYMCSPTEDLQVSDVSGSPLSEVSELSEPAAATCKTCRRSPCLLGTYGVTVRAPRPYYPAGKILAWDPSNAPSDF